MTTLDLVKILNQQANEVASEGRAGCGNTMRDAADKLEELQERVYQLENQCAKSALTIDYTEPAMYELQNN